MTKLAAEPMIQPTTVNIKITLPVQAPSHSMIKASKQPTDSGLVKMANESTIQA